MPLTSASMHSTICTKMESSILLHLLCRRPLLPFRGLRVLVRTLYVSASLHFDPRFPHLKSCNHCGLLTVQEVDGFDILASNFSTYSPGFYHITTMYDCLLWAPSVFIRLRSHGAQLQLFFLQCPQLPSPIVFLSNFRWRSQPW